MQRAGNMNWILSQIKPKCVSFMAYDLYYLALHLDLLYRIIGCIGLIVQHCIGFIGFNALNKLQIWPWHWFSSWHTVAQFSIQVDIGYLEILCRLLTSKARSDQCCIPCWHACKHAKPIGYIDMRSCQLSCRCSTLGTDHACNAVIAMRNCGSELCIVIKHAHINAFAAIHFPWNASVLVFASIGSYIHTVAWPLQLNALSFSSSASPGYFDRSCFMQV